MGDYDKDVKKKVLQGYLGRFYTPISPKMVEIVTSLKLEPFKTDYFIKGNRRKFASFIAFYLLKGGRKSWDVRNVYELIEIYLGKVEEVKSIFDLTSEFMVLTQGNEEFENKRQWDVINQYLAWRTLERKRFLLFSFDVSQAYRNYSTNLAPELRQYVKFIDLEKFN